MFHLLAPFHLLIIYIYCLIKSVSSIPVAIPLLDPVKLPILVAVPESNGNSILSIMLNGLVASRPELIKPKAVELTPLPSLLVLFIFPTLLAVPEANGNVILSIELKLRFPPVEPVCPPAVLDLFWVFLTEAVLPSPAEEAGHPSPLLRGEPGILHVVLWAGYVNLFVGDIEVPAHDYRFIEPGDML